MIEPNYLTFAIIKIMFSIKLTENLGIFHSLFQTLRSAAVPIAEGFLKILTIIFKCKFVKGIKRVTKYVTIDSADQRR